MWPRSPPPPRRWRSRTCGDIAWRCGGSATFQSLGVSLFNTGSQGRAMWCGQQQGVGMQRVSGAAVHGRLLCTGCAHVQSGDTADGKTELWARPAGRHGRGHKTCSFHNDRLRPALHPGPARHTPSFPAHPQRPRVHPPAHGRMSNNPNNPNPLHTKPLSRRQLPPTWTGRARCWPRARCRRGRARCSCGVVCVCVTVL